MKNLFKILGIILLVALIGFMMSCETEVRGTDNTDSSLNGTWVDDNGNTLRIGSGMYEINGNLGVIGINGLKGSFTAGYGNITLQPTHISIGGRWYSKQEVIEEDGEDSPLIETFFAKQLRHYIVDGDKLTWWANGESAVVYTKQQQSSGGGTTNTSLNGTWVDGTLSFTANNGQFQISESSTGTAMKGTYTTSRTSITITVTHVNGSMFGLGNNWYSRTQIQSAFGSSITTDMLDGIFYTSTGAYSVSENSLVMTINGATQTFTKSGSGGGSNGGSLQDETWVDGSITNSATSVDYSFNVTSGIKYYIWWNDDYEGDGSKTLDIKVSARYENGTVIFSEEDLGWYSPQSFTAVSTGTVILTVQPYTSGDTGTYGIMYNTNGSNLQDGTWVDGSITNSATSVDYSFNVTSGITYYIWWNDDYEGNGSKTLDIKVSAWYENGTVIFSGEDLGWYSPQSYTATSTGTVTLMVQPYTSGNTGTYGIMYSTNSDSNRSSLQNGTGVNGSITGSAAIVDYSFNVTSGTTYYIWWNDDYEGDGSKTLDIKVSARYENGTVIFSEEDSGWDSPQSFTAVSTGTVILTVQPYISENTGTYGIGYSTSR